MHFVYLTVSSISLRRTSCWGKWFGSDRQQVITNIVQFFWRHTTSLCHIDLTATTKTKFVSDNHYFQEIHQAKCTIISRIKYHIDGLVQERCNYISHALELRFFALTHVYLHQKRKQISSPAAFIDQDIHQECWILPTPGTFPWSAIFMHRIKHIIRLH